MRGERLALIREQRGLTQVELAQQLQLGDQQIWRYENGKTNPDGDTVARIAKHLNVSTDYLLGLTDIPLPYIEGELTEKERKAINAWRRGEKFEAVKTIMDDK